MGKPSEGAAPPTWKLMLVKWLGLFPPLLGVAYGLQALGVEPLWWKLVLETAVIVPLLNFVIAPFMDSLFSRWLYAGVDEEQQRKKIDIGN